jgi:hypothetical protein
MIITTLLLPLGHIPFRRSHATDLFRVRGEEGVRKEELCTEDII